MTLTAPAQIMLFYMLFWTGCRIGEALALTWDDVDGDSIHITKTLSYLHGSAYVRPPKTRESNRTVKLPSFVVAMLADYKRRAQYVGPRLFHTTSSAAARVLARHAEQAGIERIRVPPRRQQVNYSFGSGPKFCLIFFIKKSGEDFSPPLFAIRIEPL